MEGDLEKRWVDAKSKFISRFGEPMEIDTILFLIGVQTLGKGFQTYDKEDKINLMHIAVCRLLSQYGYYTITHKDKKGWPHYRINELPKLTKQEQEKLLRESIITYTEIELL